MMARHEQSAELHPDCPPDCHACASFVRGAVASPTQQQFTINTGPRVGSTSPLPTSQPTTPLQAPQPTPAASKPAVSSVQAAAAAAHATVLAAAAAQAAAERQQAADKRGSGKTTEEESLALMKRIPQALKRRAMEDAQAIRDGVSLSLPRTPSVHEILQRYTSYVTADSAAILGLEVRDSPHSK
eukprot:m51a1_g13948 hypothetical protein (185) ;mRNA; f:905220-905774